MKNAVGKYRAIASMLDTEAWFLWNPAGTDDGRVGCYGKRYTRRNRTGSNLRPADYALSIKFKVLWREKRSRCSPTYFRQDVCNNKAKALSQARK
jgi:hypothetical protein